MDEIAFNGVVQVTSSDGLALQQTTLNPADLTAALLVHEEPRAQLLGLDVQEAGEFAQVHGCVELQVRPDSGVEEGVLDLIHEDGGVVVDRVDVDGWVVKVGGSRADELGACRAEELLEQGQSLGSTALEAMELLTVLLTEGGVNGVVKTSGVESDADSDQSVHLVVLLGDGIVLVAALLEVLCSGHIDEDVAEHADGVGVAAHHHVGETHIVVGCEVSSHDTGEHGLLVHFNIVESLEGKAEVTEQAVNAQQSNDGEVSKHFVQWTGAIFSSNSQRVFSALDGSELFVDL